MKAQRQYPIGAEILNEGVSFRVYASTCTKVEVVHIEGGQTFELLGEGNGYFSGVFPAFKANDLYAFRLNDKEQNLADPASRYQPQGPLGPSQIIDSEMFNWSDSSWKGGGDQQKILYELHVGTFTPEGTFAAAATQLKELADLGITVIEVMPINEFPGEFGWGYDGVNLFAPYHLYGRPEDVKSFIQEAHRLNVAVILDVVYNHFGPEGNFINQFSEEYFLDEDTEWGRAINFDKTEVREFFLSNVRYWIEEMHFDGLRLDATQSIFCTAPVHILSEITQTARKAAPDRGIFVIGENEPQKSLLMRPVAEGGYGLDALWNDDFHHSSMVRLMGKRGAYYKDYKGTPQELISSLKYGFLFQGQYYVWQDQRRGSSSLDLPYQSFVQFIQNHDQIANSGNGSRIHALTDLGNLRAMTCLFLIAPQIPLIFQGQEFMSSAPFLYFADYQGKMADRVDRGRKKSLEQFENLATAEIQENLPLPHDRSTFDLCKLKFEERQTHHQAYQLHKDLLKLRKEDLVFSDPEVKLDGAVLQNDVFVIRFFSDHGTRLLLINFGIDLELLPVSEPLLAPPEDQQWKALWSSESSQYGGQGTVPFDETLWSSMGHSAVIFTTKRRSER